MFIPNIFEKKQERIIKMKKKLLTILFAAAVSASLFVGCGADSQTAGETNEVQAENTEAIAGTEEVKDEASQEPTELKMVVFNSMIAHIDSIVAQNKGLFEKYNIKSDFTYNNSNPENIQALLEGKLDLVAAGTTAVFTYIDQGSDIVIIGGQMSSGETLYALPERADEFKELNQETLAGKKIGVTRMNTGDIVFRHILKQRGVDLSTVEFVELDSQNTVIQAVTNGEVDLGIAFLTFRAIAEEQGLVPLTHFDGEDEWPGFVCCRLFTTREDLDANRDAFVNVLKANIEAYALIQENPDEAVELALQDISIEEDVLRNQLFEYGHVGVSPNPDLKNSSEFYDAMVDIGYIEGNVDIKDYIDTSLYIEALEQLLEENPDNEVYKELWEESEATNR